MTKLEFTNQVNKIFKNYGFKIYKNKFLIEYPDVFVLVVLDKLYENYVFDYTFRIKKLFNDDIDLKNYFEGYCLLAMDQFMKKDGSRFNYETFDEKYLTEILIDLIEKNILPFKENAINHIIEMANKGKFILNKNTKEYLEL